VAIRDFRDLEVWQTAVDLSVTIYKLTKVFPAEERFALTAQLRSAAVSVPSNIAEGNGRGSVKDYARFLMTSKGSLNEVISLLEVSCRLEILGEQEVEPARHLADRVGQMLMALRSRLLKRRAPMRR
jgi:four helix bundle protein